MFTLQVLLDAFAEGGVDAVTALYAENADVNVTALRDEAADSFQALYAAEDRSADDVAQMAVLADLIDSLRAEEARRAELSAQAQAQADELRLRALGAPIEVAVEASAEATPEPVVEAEVLPQRRPRVDLAALARRAPVVAPPVVAEPVAPRAVIVAASDVPGFTTGAELTFAGAADALLARSKSFPTEYVSGRHIAHQFAMVRKPERQFALVDGVLDMDVLDAVADETRLDGGSLVAAGGWCAPSEVWYDLCPGLESGAGILDIPGANAMRGGVRWTKGPQFCDFYGGTGFWTMTEAQDISGVFTKPCYEIPCPDFLEDRLEAYGLCLTAGILQNKGYPEYVSRFIQGSLVAHAHRMNALKIKSIVAQSTAVTSLRDGVQVGAANSVLESLELHIVSYRYRFRMEVNRSLEVVLPIWIQAVIRADLGRRNGVEVTSVSNQMIRTHFADIGANVQFVYDWQDSMCGSLDVDSATPIGGPPAAVTDWPTTVKALIYPAGAFVQLEQDVITLESVYDSVLFKANRYTALFTEEAWTVINRCYESLLLTIDITANGVSGAQRTAPV